MRSRKVRKPQLYIPQRFYQVASKVIVFVLLLRSVIELKVEVKFKLV